MRPSRPLATLLMVALTFAACSTSVPPSDAPANASSASSTDSRNGKIPSFSNPTDISNAYLPFAQGGRWIYEGTKAGKPYLVEVAVTNDTKTIEWNGSSTEALVVRHRGWVDGVLIEEALDYYAQGDDGGVWYFGEDVDNFKKGKIVDHDGSWIAGVDGALPALLMPGDPQVGQVFYSEDIVDLGIVERDKILSLTQRARTPEGSVDTALLLGATQPDGTKEHKIYVPEVGEVLARSGEGTVRLVQRLEDNAESATAAQFSEPTVVDNPYFGVTGVDYRLYLGTDEGEPLRIETAPTGKTKTIAWQGGSTEAVVSEFIATSDRSILEIAVDWFAQDDAGNVWYFGENVWNYEKGQVANTDGTWIAGSDGPPGLIMPGNPTDGQRFNPENIPGFVFETVDVQSLDATYKLPVGSVANGVLKLHETLDDGTEEIKRYAPGYGNVSEDVRGVEHVDIVYALPNDSIDARLPKELATMLKGLRAMSMRGTGRIEQLQTSLSTFAKRGDAVPPILMRIARGQLDALGRALAGPQGIEARMAALDAEQTMLDIARLYRTGRPVDLDVLDLHARRMLAAADAGDLVSAATAAALAAGVSDRIAPNLNKRAGQAAEAADAAGRKKDLAGIAQAASQLRAAVG